MNRPRNMGTLGVAITLQEHDGQTFFTASHHVLPDLNAMPRVLELYSHEREDGRDWMECNSLVLPTLDGSVGDEAVMKELDLRLLVASQPGTNVPPVSKPISKSFAGPSAGDKLQFCGLRERAWVETQYDGFYQHSDESWSRRLDDLDTAKLGVLTLNGARSARSYQGNSGALLWHVRSRSCAVAGHLVAVSLDGKRAVFVNYAVAFRRLKLKPSVRGDAE